MDEVVEDCPVVVLLNDGPVVVVVVVLDNGFLVDDVEDDSPVEDNLLT